MSYTSASKLFGSAAVHITLLGSPTIARVQFGTAGGFHQAILIICVFICLIRPCLLLQVNNSVKIYQSSYQAKRVSLREPLFCFTCSLAMAGSP